MSPGDWLTKRPPEDGAAFFCYEAEEKNTLGAWLAEQNGDSYTALIGPEGGFTPAEAEQAKAAGVFAVTLGPRILRAETAAIATLAVVQHIKGDLGRVD